MIDPAIFVCFQNIGIRAHKIHCIININNNLAMSNFLWVRIYIVTTYCEYETYWLITSKTRGLDVVRTGTSHWWVNALWVFSICYVDVQLWRSHRSNKKTWIILESIGNYLFMIYTINKWLYLWLYKLVLLQNTIYEGSNKIDDYIYIWT